MSVCPSCFKNAFENGICKVCGYQIGRPSEWPYSLPIGTALEDRYVIGKVLGAGGFGITYLACDVEKGYICAIKEYFPSHIARRIEDGEVYCAQEDMEEYEYGYIRFYEEANLLHSLGDIPAIVRVFDFFSANHTVYMVMEYADGPTLQQQIEAGGNTPPASRIIEVFTNLLLALRDVHARSLLHRDISPKNIILTRDRGVKLIDFGAARYVTREHSRSLSVLLHVGFAPPEQYSTNGNQGPWTDLYALASTMYYFACGWRVPDAMDRLNDVDQYQNLEIFRPDLPPYFTQIINTCLKIDLRQRYQTVADVLEAINKGEGDGSNKKDFGGIKRGVIENIFGRKRLQIKQTNGPWEDIDFSNREIAFKMDIKGQLISCSTNDDERIITLKRSYGSVIFKVKMADKVRYANGAMLNNRSTYRLRIQNELLINSKNGTTGLRLIRIR